MDAATGNERRPMVARRYTGKCSRCDADERRQWHQADHVWMLLGALVVTPACL